jgi:hypothetical protein
MGSFLHTQHKSDGASSAVVVIMVVRIVVFAARVL